MTNFCPSCGAKVDEVHKFCLSCGANLESGNASNPDKPEEKINQESYPPPTPTQQGYVPPNQPKSKKNMFIALIAIIIIVIIIVVIFKFLGGGVLDNRFVGDWEQYDDGFTSLDWTFNGDGSLEIMGLEIGSWSVEGDKVCLRADEVWDEFIPQGSVDKICYDFEFSDSGNTLTLSIDDGDFTVLTKK
jgi:hypothetical protein